MKKMLFWASCLIISLMTISCQREKNNVTMKDYYESVVKEISSPQYYGRSLYNGGIFKSADFIINQLAMSGIEPCVFQAKRENLPEVVGIFGPVGTVLEEEVSKIYPKENEEKERYFQRFTFPYNTFRGEAVFIVDGKVWKPTVDYVFKEFSPESECQGEVTFLDDENIYSKENFIKTLNDENYRNKFVVIDFDLFIKIFGVNGEEPYKSAIVPLTAPSGIIFEYDNRPGFFKSRSSYTAHIPVVAVQKPFPRSAKNVYVKVDSEMTSYPGRNIIAQIKGKKNPDSFRVFTAHYDHLGVMGGDNVFYGANDNASGVAMLLSLAKYYSQTDNHPDESLIFVFFDGEEANLLGSWYLSANPTFPLDKVKLLINLDMIGDVAEDVDNKVLTYQVSMNAESCMDTVRALNDRNHYFTSICGEELSDDSDNYPFDILGLPVLYLSISGKYNKDYHSPRDTFNVDASHHFNAIFDICTAL